MGASRCPACVPTYGPTWHKVSKAVRAAQPWCSIPGCTNRRLEVDHIDPANLSAGVQVLCATHHHDKTAGQRAQRGGGAARTGSESSRYTPLPDANAYARRTP